MVSLTLSYSSKINGYLYPQRVSPHLKKKHRDMLSEGNAVHPLQIANGSLARFFF
jgi:hypothetical protein